MSKPIIGYAGLTHLGLNSAAASAKNGFTVIGYHGEADYIARINSGKLPITEPGLDVLIAKNKSRITITNDLNLLKQCDIIYISSDVPTDNNGDSDLAPINKMILDCKTVMKSGSLLIVLCQVPPGFTRQLPHKPELLYYQVETLIFGKAVERATQPERLIIGCENPKNRLDARLEIYLESFNCPILKMRYESAELAKISINMCLVASISVANTMAEICENIGADWSEILPSLKLDERIGEFSYLKPGLGIAGGNLERDLYTVLKLSESHKTDGGVIKAWIRNSVHRRDWAWRILYKKVLNQNPRAIIGILGLAYKENTDSIKNSPSLALINQLKGFNIRVHDPVVSNAATEISIISDAEEVARNANAIVIMTPWPEYANLDLTKLSSLMSGNIVLDPYAVLDGNLAKSAGLNYLTLGLSDLPTDSQRLMKNA